MVFYDFTLMTEISGSYEKPLCAPGMKKMMPSGPKPDRCCLETKVKQQSLHNPHKSMDRAAFLPAILHSGYVHLEKLPSPAVLWFNMV